MWPPEPKLQECWMDGLVLSWERCPQTHPIPPKLLLFLSWICCRGVLGYSQLLTCFSWTNTSACDFQSRAYLRN